MFIKDILYFNKEDSEAEIIVSDGHYMVNCYIYPIKHVAIGCKIGNIDGFGCAGIVIANEKKYEVKKLSQYFAYQLTAKFVDNKNRVVRIGGLFINLDTEIPKDITNGDYIAFSVTRLDC